MASKYRKKFQLPEGFYPILENYCREVLRDQPMDITEFSYLYFKALDEVSKIIAKRFFRAHSILSTTQRRAKTFLQTVLTVPWVWRVKNTTRKKNTTKKAKKVKKAMAKKDNKATMTRTENLFKDKKVNSSIMERKVQKKDKNSEQFFFL